jgi:hypothetical protein
MLTEKQYLLFLSIGIVVFVLFSGMYCSPESKKVVSTESYEQPSQPLAPSAPSSPSAPSTPSLPLINDGGLNNGLNPYYRECPSAVSYPSPGCELEDPSGDVLMGVGHYAAVDGNPEEANRLGQYAPGSIDRRSNGGSNVYYRPYGTFDSEGPLAPGVTLARC